MPGRRNKPLLPPLMYWIRRVCFFFSSNVMDKALSFPCLPFCFPQHCRPGKPAVDVERSCEWHRRRSSCWNDGGSDARWQRSKRRAGSILISTPSRCRSTQQAPETVPVCPGVGSHLLPRWIHHSLLLLHVSCDIIHLIPFELCPCTHTQNPPLVLPV